jgi:DNA-binding transcriptional LysR family regulator
MAMPPPPDWNDLHPFLALARHGSLAAAARALGLRHSTVSRRIAAFEHRLGTRLFHRTSTGTTLTDAGTRLLPLAIKAEAAFVTLIDAARDQPHVLRLSVPTGFAPILAPALVAVQKARPTLTINVLSTSQPTDIAAGLADIALRLSPTRDPALLTRTVAQVGLALYASPAYLRDHPATDPFSFAGHHMIGLHPDLSNSPAARWLDDHAGEAATILRLSQMTEVCATAASAAGLALLPCLLGDAQPGLIRVHPAVLLHQPLTLVCRRDVARDPVSRRLIDTLVRAVKRRSDALAGEI